LNRLKEIDRYILAHIDDEDPVLTELDRETHLKVLGARMISGHLQGQVLTMISKMICPQNILELGTFTGYSAICLAKGLRKGGRLITIEIDDELEELSRKYFQKAGMQDIIDLYIGSALDIIPTLSEDFDLVFMDADKREYVQCYNLLIERLKSGAYILADNTLWNEKVLDEPKPKDLQTRGILAFNDLIKNDPRVEKVIIPLRDGLTVIRKR